MKIAICDDEKVMRIELCELLTRLQDAYDERFEIVQFDNGGDLCAQLNELDLDLIFLDYKMKGIDGVETAKSIYYSNNHKVKIIFITGFDTVAKFLFRLNVIDFIVKPVSYETLKDAVDYYYKEHYTHQYPTFKFKYNKEEWVVPLTEIVCFQTGNDHSTIIYLNGGAEAFEFRRLFRDVWDEVKQYNFFVLPNRFHIINLLYAQHITSNSMEILDKTVSIGRKFKQDTKGRYLRFLKEQMRGATLRGES